MSGFPLKITYGYVSSSDSYNFHDKYVFLVNFRKICEFFFTGTFVLFTGGNFHFFHAHHFLFSRERFGGKFHGDF